MFLFSMYVCLDLFSVLLYRCNYFKSLQLPPISLPPKVSAPLSSPSPLFWGSLSSSPLLSPLPFLVCLWWLVLPSRHSHTYTLFYIHTLHLVNLTNWWLN